MIEIKTFYCNLLRECTYLVFDETGECVIIDPGCMDENEFSRIERFVGAKNLKPAKVILTHGHFDHIIGVQYIVDRWQVDFFAHPNEIALFPRYCHEGDMLGFSFERDLPDFSAISDGDIISFGKSRLTVIDTPGHSVGSICLFDEADGILFSGDTLFQGSIGRTDLFGGDSGQIMKSLKEKLAPLPDEVQVYPGHGYPTTIGEEKQSNPFLI